MTINTWGVRAAPALGQTQGVAPPRWGRLAVGEARWGAWRGYIAAPGPLRDLPQLVRQGGLAMRDRARRPGRFHLWQFTWLEKREGNVGIQNQVTKACMHKRAHTHTHKHTHTHTHQEQPRESVLQSKISVSTAGIHQDGLTYPLPPTTQKWS